MDFFFGLLTFRDYLSEHWTVVTEHLGDFSRIHAVDSGNFLLFHPFVQALDSIPVAILEWIFWYHEASYPDFFGFKVLGYSILVNAFIRNAVVSDKRIGDTKNLSGIGRVREAFRITYHGSGEYHFSIARLVITEGPSFQFHSILKTECCAKSFFHFVFAILYLSIYQYVKKKDLPETGTVNFNQCQWKRWFWLDRTQMSVCKPRYSLSEILFSFHNTKLRLISRYCNGKYCKSTWNC